MSNSALVVDDVPANRDFLERLMTQAGFEVFGQVSRQLPVWLGTEGHQRPQVPVPVSFTGGLIAASCGAPKPAQMVNVFTKHSGTVPDRAVLQRVNQE